MNNVLVIWWTGEEVRFVDLNVKKDGDDFELLKSFHNKFINGFDEETSEKIHNFFYDDDTDFRFESSYDAKQNVKYDLIIVTGFIP